MSADPVDIVLSSVEMPDVLSKLIISVAAEITEINAVADVLRHVPKCVGCLHSLQIPGAEKKKLVLLALHGLSEQLEKAQKITTDFRKELDTFVDAVVPVTIDSVLDVAKGRVSFAKAAEALVTNPAVVSTALTCCMGFFTRFAKKSVVAATIAVPPTPAPTPASSPVAEVIEAVKVDEAAKSANPEAA